MDGHVRVAVVAVVQGLQGVGVLGLSACVGWNASACHLSPLTPRTRRSLAHCMRKITSEAHLVSLRQPVYNTAPGQCSVGFHEA